MRSISFILILAIFISCKNSNNTKSSSDTSTEKKGAVTTSGANRPVLIQELQRIKAAFASGDKERIAEIFPFPVSDSALPVIPFDSTYMKELNDNGEEITRAMFIKYFDESYKYLQMEEINELFKYLNVDELNHKDSLGFEVKTTKEPCFKYYAVYIDEDSVSLIFGTLTNSAYVDPDKKSQDDEDLNDACEFTSAWTFQFDGKRLRFDRISLAG